MAYSFVVPAAVSVGDLVTVDDHINVWSQTLGELASPPACRVYRSSTTAVASGSEVTISFSAERYDTDSMWEGSTNPSRITINTAGLYVVTANIAWGTDNDYTRRICDILLNGTTIIARRSDETGANIAFGEGWSLSTQYKFAAADFIEVRVYQANTSGAANNIVAATNYSPEFAATWIGTGNPA